jgi:hypothetical protein
MLIVIPSVAKNLLLPLGLVRHSERSEESLFPFAATR